MKRSWFVFPIVLVAIVAIGVIRHLGQASPALISFRQSRQVMGTLASIEAVGPAGNREQLRQAVQRAFAAVDRVDVIMSNYKSDSLVSRINREAADRPVDLDSWTAEVLKQSKHYWRLSNGAFDPTCGPLIELWKRCGKADRLPTAEELANAKARTGFDKVELDTDANPPTIRFTEPGMEIDLGGIAKGFSIDLAAEALKQAGCTGGLVDIGGDIRTFGRPDDDENWEIAVQDPFKEGTLQILSVNDTAVCTSGNYQRYAIIQGHRYSHIIDPRTGYPAEAAPSVTVIGPETTGTDALATAVSVLGATDGMKLIHAVPHYETMLVVGTPKSFEMRESPGYARYVRSGEGQ